MWHLCEVVSVPRMPCTSLSNTGEKIMYVDCTIEYVLKERCGTCGSEVVVHNVAIYYMNNLFIRFQRVTFRCLYHSKYTVDFDARYI
jgi:rRNA maturation protein Nop10